MWTGWGVVICILEFGGANAEITQQPSLVLQEGQDAHFKCHQTNNHNYMYWYRQKAGQGPEFLFYFFNNQQQQQGDNLERISATQPGKYRLNLTISPVERNDSASYLCVSSEDTVLQSHSHFIQKPACIIT